MTSKNIFLIGLIALFIAPAYGQMDRTKAPIPGPAPKFDMGEFSEFELNNGLKVIIVENHKTPRISYQLFIDRAPMVEADKVGLARFTGDMLGAGTQNMDKARLDEEIDFYGARFFTSSSMIYMSGLSRHKKELIGLMSEVALKPTFPQEELDKLKKQSLSSLEANKEDPSSIARNIRTKVMYGTGHPYGEVQNAAHIENISTVDCQEFYRNFFTPKSAYLVIVGDITVSEAKKFANSYFKEWEGHKLVRGAIELPAQPASTQVSFGHKSGAVQSAVSVSYPIDNKPGSKDEVIADVMNEILGGTSFGARLMQNLREDKAYTYGCRSNLSSDRYAASFNASASVRNEVTADAIKEILFEMDRMTSKKVSEEELQRVKNSIKGSFSRSLENSQTIASFALNIARFGLPKDYYNTYLTKVEAVTLDDVLRISKKYLRPNNAHVVVVGDGVTVAGTLNKFGAVSFYDALGESTTPPGFELEEGTTALSVLNKALDAFGGKEKLASVKNYTVRVEGAGSMGTLEIKRMAIPKKESYYQSMWMGDNVLTTMKIYKGKYYLSGPQGEQEVMDDQKEELRSSIPLHEEMNLVNQSGKLTLLGGEFYNDEKVAVIEVAKGERIQKRYYSLETGFLVASSEMSGERELVWQYSNYTDYSGIMLPKESKNNGMPFSFSVSKVEINQGVDKKKFKF